MALKDLYNAHIAATLGQWQEANALLDNDYAELDQLTLDELDVHSRLLTEVTTLYEDGVRARMSEATGTDCSQVDLAPVLDAWNRRTDNGKE